MVEGLEHTSTRVLYISDSIGLGHAARDLAIARELRTLNPEVEIVWLAGEPARRLIAEAGETLLPETEAFAHETGVAEDASEGFSLNVLRYALRAQGAWKQAATAFEEVTARYPYDLLIGDESYEIDAALSEQPALKKAPFVMIYDFVELEGTTQRSFSSFTQCGHSLRPVGSLWWNGISAAIRAAS